MKPFHKQPSSKYRHGVRIRPKEDALRESLLTDWYGEDYAILEIEAGQKREQKIGDLVNEVVSSLDKGDRALLRKIVADWQHLFEPDIYANSSPRTIYNKTLLIEVSDSSWRFNMEYYLKDEIREIVRRSTDNRVTDIRFVPAGRTRRFRSTG